LQAYNLELTLENPPLTADLTNAAAYFAQDALAQCTDVAAMAFSSGHKFPSEEMLSSVVGQLRNLVLGIERAVLERTEESTLSQPISWNLLLQSGFLRDPGLIDFCLAQFAASRLNAQILGNGDIPAVEQLPARLLTDQNGLISNAAKCLLTSEAQARRFPGQIHHQLSAELLHRITWRIVAALQIAGGDKDETQFSNAKTFLANHNESKSIRSAARKIVYFLGDEGCKIVFDPSRSGISVFASAISAATGADHDHVLRLADGHSCAPLATLLRACGVPRESAMEAICLLKGFSLTPLEVSYVDRHYDVLPIGEAKAEVALWHAARAMQLAFPGVSKVG
jgi:hypothetical protein